MPGTVLISPGSVLWVPEAGIRAVPIELGSGQVVGAVRVPFGKGSIEGVQIDTTVGLVQLDKDADLWDLFLLEAEEMAQEQGQRGG